MKPPSLCARLGVAVCALLPSLVLAQAYPSKPIRVVVPYPPGAGVDFAARLYQVPLSAALGQPIVIDNRGGATGAIGMEAVVRAAPDGHTLLFSVGAEMVLRRFLEKNPAYDIARDFTPIAPVVVPVSCFVVGPQVPVNSMREMIEYARRNPGKLNYGSSGINSVFHVMGEYFKLSGVEMTHVPFKGLAQAMTAVLGSEIEVTLTNLTTALPPSRTGKVRILAMLTGQRFEGMPDIPTVQETLRGFDFPIGWYGFFGPAGVPQPIASRLNAEIVKATESAELSARIREGMMMPIKGTPEQFAALVANSTEGYGRIVKAAGIQPQ